MPADITQLLNSAREGDRDAVEQLYARVYGELRRIARARLRRHRPGETLNTTALVHEAYLKLVDSAVARATDRAHFLALASRAMRFVLVDYARARSAKKRGGSADRVPLDAVQVAGDDRAVRLIELSDALERLSAYDERLGRVVEYKFFGGLTYEEIAEATGYSVATVKRDWNRAGAWLYRALWPAAT